MIRKNLTHSSRDRLLAVAKYLIAQTDKSSITPESRSVKYHRVFLLLKRMRLPLFILIFAQGFFYFLKSGGYFTYNGCVIADHSSEVIKKNISDYNKEMLRRNDKPSMLKCLIVLMYLSPKFSDIYKAASPKRAFDVKRVLSLFYSYVYWSEIFSINPSHASLIAMTNQPLRLALGVVSNDRETPVLAWTVGKYGVKAPPPIAVDVFFCWTHSQAHYLSEYCNEVVEMRVEKKPEKFLLKGVKEKKIALLLNARVDYESMNRFIKYMYDEFNIKGLRVRPHPGAKIKKKDVLPIATLCNWKEPLNIFLEDVCAVFCMSSSAILDALLNGVPVIYINGLDDFPGDVTGLVDMGIVPAYSNEVDPVDLIKSHYSSESSKISGFLNDFNGEISYVERALKKYDVI